MRRSNGHHDGVHGGPDHQSCRGGPDHQTEAAVEDRIVDAKFGGVVNTLYTPDLFYNCDLHFLDVNLSILLLIRDKSSVILVLLSLPAPDLLLLLGVLAPLPLYRSKRFDFSALSFLSFRDAANSAFEGPLLAEVCAGLDVYRSIID